MRLRSSAAWLATALLVNSCSMWHNRADTASPLKPAPAQGGTLRDAERRFSLTVPRDGLRQVTGKYGIALETRNGSHGYSVQVYDWPRAGTQETEALKTAFKTRVAEVARTSGYGYSILKQQPITRYGRQGLEAQFMLLPKRGWARRAYVCQIIAAENRIYWMHASMLRTAQFGDISEKFLREARAFFTDVHFADEIKASHQPSPAAAATAARDESPPR